MSRHICRLLLPALAASGLFAQTAQITGIVTDESGAAVPAAAVQAIALATGVTARAETNQNGIYRLQYLQPGSYRIEIEAGGFRKYTQEPVTLQVADRATIDIRLQIGAQTESITVTAGARIIETESAEFTQLVNQRTIQELPLNKREAMQLVLLAPGFTADRTFDTGSSGDSSPNYFATRWRMGGSRPMVNEVLLDGVPNTGADKSFMQYNPPVDVAQEFKIQANAFSAEYGRTSGPVISIATKAGTNELHGVVYEFLRNSALDANDFFANAAGRPRPGFRRNQFGATAGGPAIRNKLFFFGDYDGQLLSAPNTRISTVPTTLQKEGNFTRTFDPGNRMIQAYDPLTTVVGADGRASRQPFSGNVIPRARFDPVAVNSVKFYPEPNAPGDPVVGTNNYISVIPRSQDWNRFGGRLDYYLSGSNRIFGRYAEQKSSQVLPGRWDGPSGGGRHVDDWYRNVTLNDTHTISPTLNLEIRAGYAGSGAFWGNDDDGFDMTTLGLPASLRQTAMSFFPVFNISDVAALGGASFLDFARHTFSAQGILSKAAGRHFLKMGGDTRWLQANTGQNRNPSGTYAFNRGFTRGPDPQRVTSDAGHGLASFLLGTGADGVLDHASAPALQVRYTAFFFQDDWKLNSRLTVNLGLRYSVEQGISERTNRIATFEPGVPSPLGTVGGLALRGALRFRDPNSRNLFHTDWNNLEPRVGFAYQVTPETVVRSGYGIFFAPRQIISWGGQVGLTNTSPWVTSVDGGLTPRYLISNPFPQGFNLLPDKPDPLTNLGSDLQGFFTHEPLGYMQQWDFSIQRQLASDLAVEATYWGSKGTRLQWPAWQLNQLPNQYMSLGNALNAPVPNPFFGTIRTGVLAQPTIPRRQTLLPFPQFASLVRSIANAGSSIYHGFTLRAEKRAARGLGFVASYTLGKVIDDTSGQETFLAGPNSSIYDNENRRIERSLSAFDVPRRLVVSSLYDLPFGRNRTFASKVHPLANAVIGGWSLGVLTQLQSGLPINLARNSVSTGKSAKLDKPTIARWFDTTAFIPAEPFTYGNVGRLLPDVRTDGLAGFDISAMKNFEFLERFRLQFRAELFNAFNTPQFGYPSGGLATQTFGRVTSQYNSPRQVQFALKLYY